MDFRHISTRVPRIFPMRKFPAVLNSEYRKLDFSSKLDALPLKRVERREEDAKLRYDTVNSCSVNGKAINRVEQELTSVAPFTVLQTSDDSRCESFHPFESHAEFRSNLVEPIIDSIIQTIAIVHTEPSEP